LIEFAPPRQLHVGFLLVLETKVLGKQWPWALLVNLGHQLARKRNCKWEITWVFFRRFKDFEVAYKS